MPDFFSTNTGGQALYSSPTTLSAILASLAQASPAPASPSATPTASAAPSSATGVNPAGGGGVSNTGGLGAYAGPGTGQDFANANAAVKPNLGNSLKLAAMIAGLGLGGSVPETAATLLGGNLTGLTGNPFTGPQLGASLDPAAQAQVAGGVSPLQNPTHAAQLPNAAVLNQILAAVRAAAQGTTVGGMSGVTAGNASPGGGNIATTGGGLLSGAGSGNAGNPANQSLGTSIANNAMNGTANAMMGGGNQGGGIGGAAAGGGGGAPASGPPGTGR